MRNCIWRSVAAGMGLCLGAVVAAASIGGGSRPLSEAEMGSARGLSKRCQDFMINTENWYSECIYSHSPFDNSCDFLSCVESGSCGRGDLFANKRIYFYWLESTWNSYLLLKTENSVFCKTTIPCNKGAFQDDRDCWPGSGVVYPKGCWEPKIPLFPEGCYPCSAGQPDLQTIKDQQFKVQPYTVPCPIPPEE